MEMNPSNMHELDNLRHAKIEESDRQIGVCDGSWHNSIHRVAVNFQAHLISFANVSCPSLLTPHEIPALFPYVWIKLSLEFLAFRFRHEGAIHSSFSQRHDALRTVRGRWFGKRKDQKPTDHK